MEFTFLKLRAKEVVNTQDGKKLGKICDIVLCYPENKWLGIVVPGGGGLWSKKKEFFIDLKRIVKIGEDVILVNIGQPKHTCEKPKTPAMPLSEAQSEGYPKRGFDEFE